MWNEFSADVDKSTSNNQSDARIPTPAEIASIESGSIAEQLGLEVGDRLLSINGVKPRDLIDYQFLIAEDSLTIEVLDQSGEIKQVYFEKESDDALGISFTEAIYDGLRQCNNHCPFCFIDQQPPGRRNSLYIKDDDYRLSFLYGSYLTLTNLNQSDWDRIASQRLSPLFVSVHSTNSVIRQAMLKNARAGKLMEQLSWFAANKLQIHAQVVVCPGINDQEALEKTLNDLAKYAKGLWPVVISTAVVPVGLTKFRPSNDALSPVSKTCALKVIKQVEALQTQFKKDCGSNFAWLSDEWYLISGQPLPVRNSYEDLPQQENGVGSIRAFLESLECATKRLPTKLKAKRSCTWIVGRLVQEALTKACQRFNNIENLTMQLIGLPSPYWGQEYVVTGLLTGQDLITGLKERDLGDELLLPSVMLKQNEHVFLDDMTVDQLEKELNIPIKIVHGADDIVAAVIGESHKIL